MNDMVVFLNFLSCIMNYHQHKHCLTCIVNVVITIIIIIITAHL